MTTIENITEHKILTLRAQTAEHGDLEQVAICLRALGGEPDDAEPGTALAVCTLTKDEALAECVRVIQDADAEQWPHA